MLFSFLHCSNQQSADEKEVVSSTSSPSLGGRGKMLQMLQKGSLGDDSEQTVQSTAEQTSREKTSQDKSSDDARKGTPALGDTGQPGISE